MKSKTFITLDIGDTIIPQIQEYGVRSLSRDIGINASMMSRWLRGKTGMSREKVEKICKILHFNLVLQ